MVFAQYINVVMRERQFLICPISSGILLVMISGRNTHRTAASGLSGSVVLIL